jgi:hypothetical protein
MVNSSIWSFTTRVACQGTITYGRHCWTSPPPPDEGVCCWGPAAVLHGTAWHAVRLFASLFELDAACKYIRVCDVCASFLKCFWEARGGGGYTLTRWLATRVPVALPTRKDGQQRETAANHKRKLHLQLPTNPTIWTHVFHRRHSYDVCLCLL